MIAFCSTVSYAATQTSDNTDSTSGEPSAVFTRSIEAGNRVSNRALSSKVKEAAAKVAPAVIGISNVAGKAATTTASVTAKTVASVPAAGRQTKTPGAQVVASQTSSSSGGKKAVPGLKVKGEKTWEDKLPDPDPEEVKLEKELEQEKEKAYEGIVAGAGFNGIAVGGQKGAPGEMWFNYAKGIRLSGVSKPSEFQMGDTVKVFYKETKNRQRFLKGVALIRKAPVAPAEEVPEEEKE